MSKLESPDEIQVLGAIRAAFAFLEREHGYREESSHYDKESFGNAAVDYRSAQLRIGVIKDRGQFFTTFAAARAGSFFDEQVVLQFLGAADEAERLVKLRWESLELQADVVRRHLARIEAAFSPEHYERTAQELTRLKHARAEALFGPSARP
jgi:hypothetical protein